MLTRHDRTVEDALDLVDVACDLGVAHIGFKDMGLTEATMRKLVATIHRRGGTSYFEVVSTTPAAVTRSLATARALGVDCVLGGTDLDAALGALGDLRRYFPFPGRPAGHPTRLQGTPALISEHCMRALAMGCGGVDLLAYRATEADPLELVRAARAALTRGRLIVAGSVTCREQVEALGSAGVDAFTVGSAVFDGTFSPAKGTLQSQLEDILAACA